MSAPAGQAGSAAAETEGGEPGRSGRVLFALLCGTLAGTVNNNIVNVPMKDILHDLHVPLSRGVLVVVAFNLTFAVLMPVTGWAGDRLGRRRVFAGAVVVLAFGAVAASLAPTLPLLVAVRVVQGAATAAITPSVMAIIADTFGPVRRGRALGLWAATNGLGQAIGPPLGGWLADAFGWRSIFWPVLPVTAIALYGALRWVPADRGRHQVLEWRGALSLTFGAGLLIASATAIPSKGVASVLVLALAAAGVVALLGLAVSSRRVATPFLPPGILHEPSYVRSCLAVTAQMFCLGSTLLGVPLYLTRTAHLSSARAGLLVFALPAAMTVLAPVSGFATERLGARQTLRGGMALLVVAELLVMVELAADAKGGVLLVAALALVGGAIAFVQTPAATGATRSAVGRFGTALGLFNLVRFAGSALGAAWVAIALTGGAAYTKLFAVCAVVAVLGLAGTWAGPDQPPEPAPAAGDVSRQPAQYID